MAKAYRVHSIPTLYVVNPRSLKQVKVQLTSRTFEAVQKSIDETLIKVQ